jgi:hypothetical protein
VKTSGNERVTRHRPGSRTHREYEMIVLHPREVLRDHGSRWPIYRYNLPSADQFDIVFQVKRFVLESDLGFVAGAGEKCLGKRWSLVGQVGIVTD